MLTVPNRTVWNGFFNKVNLIRNCNVKIYDYPTGGIGSHNLLIDKTNIKDFQIVSRNSFVCNEIPSDECSFTVLNFSSLSQTTQDYLSTIGKTIYITYVVNGVETTSGKYLKIKNVEINRKKTNAKIKATSLFDFMSEQAISIDGTITLMDFPSNFKTIKPQSTLAEMWQQFALFKMRGLFINKAQNNDTYPDFKKYTLQSEGELYETNIIDDFSFVYDEDKSSVVVYGIEPMSEEIHIGGGMSHSIADFFENYNDKSPYVTTRVTSNGSSVSYFRFIDGVFAFCGGTISNPAYVTVFGYKAELTEYDDDNNYTIQTYSVQTGSQQANDIQTFCQNYYSNKKMIQYECRIDPTFETLDVVSSVLENVLYFYVIEEITIKFNGGFTGSIKGRIVLENQLVAPSVQFNIDYADFNAGVDDSYSFVITNNNPVPVTFQMEVEGTAFSYSTTIPANSSVTLRSTTELTGRFDSTVLYRDKNIVGTFSYESLTTPQTTLLAEITELSAPVVVKSIDTQHHSIDVTFTNNNDCMVNLRCEGSDYTEPYSHQLRPHTSITVSTDAMSPNYDEDFDISINNCLYNYVEGYLEDDYYCYYRANDDVVSDNTIILEAQI